MRVGSLFTGYGGLDLAIDGELAWYSEIDKAACQVLAAHHPGVPNLGDITAINWADVEPVDVITGGYPCQPFSTAGNRKGKNDVRHLWPNVLDAIRAIRPRYAILENVAGHLSLGFADVLADLAEIGWDAEWGTYRASDVGAPHRRERIFIIAHTKSEGSQGCNFSPTPVDSERVRQRVAQGDSASVSAHTTRGIRGEGQGRGVPESERPTGLATHTGDIAADTNCGRCQQCCFVSVQIQGKQDGHGATCGGASAGNSTGEGLEGRRLSKRDGKSGTRVLNNVADSECVRCGETCGATPAQAGGASSATCGCSRILTRVEWGQYEPAIRRWETVLGRSAPTPTIYRGKRERLNPQFVEWMMGLPDGWVTSHGLNSSQELKMLGNGVVPQQAYEAITQLIERTRKVEK